MGRLISRRYAIALFELAKEANKIDEFYSQAENIYLAIKDDKEFLGLINNPRISKEEKFKLFEKIFKNNISEEILGLISIILKKNRETQIAEILETFLTIVKEHKGITTATVFSAIKLTKTQLKDIKEKLSKKLNKEVIIEANEQPDLIGGIVINVDGKVIDNSIKKALADVKKSLINN